jgi:hypothetical protein
MTTTPELRLRYVFDTNVLISALLLPGHEPGGAGRTDREAWTRHPPPAHLCRDHRRGAAYLALDGHVICDGVRRPQRGARSELDRSAHSGGRLMRIAQIAPLQVAVPPQGLRWD